jgi:hypothetical protein
MPATTPRIITIALATLAVAAPAATAMPLRDHTGTSRLAGTTSAQDVRNPDNRIAQDLAHLRAGGTAAAPGDDGPSRLLFIGPALALLAVLAVGMVHARISRTPRRSPA